MRAGNQVQAMKGDFSRIRFEANKHYTDVLDQQGRVAYDADHNEQRYIDGHRRTVQTTDVIGEYGAPLRDAGFDISIVGGQLQIGPGRYYVHGLLCENAEALDYDEQPFLLEGTGTGELRRLLLELRRDPALCVRVYLEVWQRMVTALDDSCLGEPALGQADTTVRLQTVWRVVAGVFKPQTLHEKTPGSANELSSAIDEVLAKSMQDKISIMRRDQELARLLTHAPVAAEPAAAEAQATGCSCEAMYRELPPAHSGLLSAQVAENSGDCGCQPIPDAGYTGQENQLYRVEIQRAGTLASATFKWSRENASVVVAVVAVSGAKVTVGSLGMDANLGFQVGQWVEISDDTYLFGEHPNRPGLLYQIQSIERPSLILTMTTTVQPVDPSRHARMRRWDQAGPSADADGVPLSADWTTLENGIQVRFRNGRYFSGDAWTIPARSATGQIDWPPCGGDGNPFQPPHYAHVYRAPLACIHLRRKTAAKEEARFVGAEAATGFGELFTVDDCRRLFPTLADLGPLARAEALHVTRINWKNDEAMSFDTLVKDGLAVAFDQAPTATLSAANFIVTLEVPTSVGNKGLVEMQAADAQQQLSATGLNLSPYAYAPVAAATVPRTPIILDSSVVRHGKVATWSLLGDKGGELQLRHLEAINTLLAPWARRGIPVRVRVRLCGRVIWADTKTGKSLYLDGQAFGTGTRSRVQGRERIDLRLPSGNEERASDFESWFYLYPAQSVEAVEFIYQRVAVSNENGIPVITNTEPAATSQPVVQRATITLAYAALETTVVQLAWSGDARVATIPAQATVPAGQTTVTIDVTLHRTPPSGKPSVFTLSASLPTALDQASAQSAEFSIIGRGGNQIKEFSATISNQKAAAGEAAAAKKKARPTRRADTKRSDS